HSFASFDSRLDYTPDALGDFTAASNAAASTVTPSTDSKTLAGLTTVTGIKIEGEGSPQYRVGSGDWTGAPGAVANNDEIEMRLTAGAVGSTRVATLTVGGETAVFSVSVSGEEGVCGAADGVATLLPPTAGLCTGGAPGAVSSVDGGHAWSCEGTDSGSTTAQCSAPGAEASGAGGSGSATFELISSDGDACVVESAHLVAPPAGLPAGASLPFGALEFALNSCTPGGSATVQISYDTPVDGLVYWKYINDAWTTMPATMSGNTASFTITDNGPYDADATPGRIADPGGPGVQPLSSGGDGVTGIPILSVWMSALLAAVLLLFGARRFSARIRG
ncbi:MAG: hypothetical protein H2060_12580, partial [Azoarcus sp.]|nr:hypothetical protein [Azoarcus sp.]